MAGEDNKDTISYDKEEKLDENKSYSGIPEAQFVVSIIIYLF